jgi:hypothetical protein
MPGSMSTTVPWTSAPAALTGADGMPDLMAGRLLADGRARHVGQVEAEFGTVAQILTADLGEHSDALGRSGDVHARTRAVPVLAQ